RACRPAVRHRKRRRGWWACEAMQALQQGNSWRRPQGGVLLVPMRVALLLLAVEADRVDMKRRFIQQRDGSLIEVTSDYVPEPRNHDAVLWNDRTYQDCGDPRFFSRSQHREYMRVNGLTTVDDFTQHFERAAEARARFYEGGDRSRKEDVARALARYARG